MNTSQGTKKIVNPLTNGTIRIQPPKAYVMYKRQKVYVTVESTFQGGTTIVANVKAVSGFPFDSADADTQGDTRGSWNCNGLRVRADFVGIEAL